VSGDCSGCHETTDCSPPHCRQGTCRTPASGLRYPPLAAAEQLRASGSGCGRGDTGNQQWLRSCHGGAVALTFYNNNEANPKSGVLPPPHIPASAYRLQRMFHSIGAYAVGGIRADEMTRPRTLLSRELQACHEAGLSF